MSRVQSIEKPLSQSLWIEIGILVLIALAFFFGTSLTRGGFETDGAGYEFNWTRLVFLFNYLMAALVINYVLLSKYYYKGKYLQFAIGIVVVIIGCVLIEELVLEKIFFPDTRGSRFTGVLFNFIRMIPMIMLFVGSKFAWDAQRKERELAQLKGAINDSQLQFLKSQINPHFLFNSLNNLYSYALEKSEKTPGIILELSSLLRYMLYDCRESYVPLDKEAKYIHDFIKLQSLQIEDRGDVTFTSSGNFKGRVIAPLILIVFIENCFKHSTSSQSDKIKIAIDLTLDNDVVYLKCQNTHAKSSNTNNLAQGIGLENVKKRLALMYPDKHKLRINDSEDVYTVDLKINIVS